MNIAFPFRVADNSNNLVPGATVAIGSTTLTSNTTTTLTATVVPANAGIKVLSTLANPAGAVTVTLFDAGTGDYWLLLDPSTFGDLYIPLTVSHGGSTITGANAIATVYAINDSGYIQTSLPNVTSGASSGLPIVTSIPTAAQNATAVAAAVPTAAQNATTLLSVTIDGTINVKQALAVLFAEFGNNGTAGIINTGTHQQTITYYEQDGVTVRKTAVVQYASDNVTKQSVAVTLSNLP